MQNFEKQNNATNNAWIYVGYLATFPLNLTCPRGVNRETWFYGMTMIHDGRLCHDITVWHDITPLAASQS